MKTAKRVALLSTLLLCAAGYVFLQTRPPALELAKVMPGGALLYAEAPNFGSLLRDWDSSALKADWLKSANYSEFSRSNLFIKLSEVFGQYGEAAGFLPDLKSITELAGTDSALALYEIRDVEFLYVSHLAEADVMKSQLWAVRDRFEQRQAGGVSFYLQTGASKRTVAFAFSKGYLFLATRDDLVAQALELFAGGGNPSVASDRWYREPVAAAPNPGELRLVMNLEALVKSVYFRSYWVQRNAATIRQYWAGVTDIRRTGGSIVENRVFLRAPGLVAAGTGPVSNLLALIPPEAGVYRASRIGSSSDAANLIVQKLIGPQPQRVRDWRDAPFALPEDTSAGSESDLETRIDEQPLPADAGLSDSVAAVRAMVDAGAARTLLLVQSSSPQPAGTFVKMPSVIVLDGGTDWDPGSVNSALTAAAAKLWTTSELGAGWVNGSAGQNSIERLDGLGTILIANRGRLLFLSNDLRLLTAVLDRSSAAPAATPLTYAAGFRHLRERSSYQSVMTALDFTPPSGNAGFGYFRDGPKFFSGNIQSLSDVLSGVAEIQVTEQDKGTVTLQTVSYQMAR